MGSRRLLSMLALAAFVCWPAAGCRPPGPATEPRAAATDAPSQADSTVTLAVPTEVPSPTTRPRATQTAELADRVPNLSPGESEVGLVTKDQAVALAKDTLAQHLDISEDEIQLQEAEQTNWPDTSLGCPEKGKMYAQVIVPGYRVLLSVAKRTFSVHVGASRAVVCTGMSGEVAGQVNIAGMAQAYELARQDLAKRLNVDIKDIKGLIKPATWPDASLGCPQPGETYTQVATQGSIVELEHGGKTYEYHAAAERVILCMER